MEKVKQKNQNHSSYEETRSSSDGLDEDTEPEDEKARTRKRDSISKEMRYNALKSKSNKRDGNPSGSDNQNCNNCNNSKEEIEEYNSKISSSGSDNQNFHKNKFSVRNGYKKSTDPIFKEETLGDEI